jgi:hypothetical protein
MESAYRNVLLKLVLIFIIKFALTASMVANNAISSRKIFVRLINVQLISSIILNYKFAFVIINLLIIMDHALNSVLLDFISEN